MWSKIVLLSVFGLTSSLTTSFDLRGVIHGDRMAGVPLGSSLGAGEVDVEGICTSAGMACKNCSMVVTCIRLPVGWLTVPQEECAAGLTCNAHLGKCSPSPVPECDSSSQEYTHSCEQVGIFPDAHDCRRFHLCSPPQGLPDGRPGHHGVALCPRNYGYNPQNAQCSIKLPHGQCKHTPVPTCAKVGDSGAVKSSLNHYYVCLMKQGKLYPQIFICPHGWYFWGGFCRPEAEPTSESNSLEKSSEEVTLQTTEKASTKMTTTEKTATEMATTKMSTTEKATKAVYKINSFFSTEKATTYPPDTFLADKIDLTNYESVDDVTQNNDDYFNSFENFN